MASASAPAARVIVGYGLTPPDAATTTAAPGSAPPAKKLRLLTLPAPSTGAPQAFALSDGGGNGSDANANAPDNAPPMLLELSRHKTKHTAWVVGRSALPDGGVVLATPVDPLLVLLPILRPVPSLSAAAAAADEIDADADAENANTSNAPMFQDLDALLTDPRWPALGALKSIARPLLPLICDVKRVGGGDDENEDENEDDADASTYYRLDDRRAAAYLRLKAKRAALALKSCASPAAAALDDEQCLAYALGWLGEWTSRAWLEAAARGLADEGGRVVPVGLPGGAGGAAAAERQRRFGGGGEAAGRGPSDDNGGLLQVPGSGAYDNSGKRPAPGGDASLFFDDGGGAGLTEEQKREAARKKAEDTRERNKQAKLQACAFGSRKISSFFSAKKK